MEKTSSNNLIKEIVEIKKENEKLEELINFLKMENFDYAMKCNHMKNVLANIDCSEKNNPGKLLEASDNICNTLQLTAGFGKLTEKPTSDQTDETVKESNNKKQCSQSLRKTPSHSNKAHVVNPHMVNGHVLYIPTINLTRVSNLQTSKKSNITPKDNEDSSMVTTSNNNDNNASHSSPNTFNESDELDNEMTDVVEGSNSLQNTAQLSRIQEVSEPSTSSSSSSKSPSHSTVLSGTFQEVKIYLNQVSPNSFNENSRKSARQTLVDSTVQSRTLRKNGRSGRSLECVTKRKRN